MSRSVESHAELATLTILVFQHVGRLAVTLDHGQAIYDLVKPALDHGLSVTLDFTGVEAVFPPFLGNAVGALLEDFDRAYLREHLSLTGLSKEELARAMRVMDHSEWFHTLDEGARNRTLQIIVDAVSDM